MLRSSHCTGIRCGNSPSTPVADRSPLALSTYIRPRHLHRPAGQNGKANADWAALLQWKVSRSSSSPGAFAFNVAHAKLWRVLLDHACSALSAIVSLLASPSRQSRRCGAKGRASSIRRVRPWPLRSRP